MSPSPRVVVGIHSEAISFFKFVNCLFRFQFRLQGAIFLLHLLEFFSKEFQLFLFLCSHDSNLLHLHKDTTKFETYSYERHHFFEHPTCQGNTSFVKDKLDSDTQLYFYRLSL